jgi:hypothetical protein
MPSPLQICELQFDFDGLAFLCDIYANVNIYLSSLSELALSKGMRGFWQFFCELWSLWASEGHIHYSNCYPSPARKPGIFVWHWILFGSPDFQLIHSTKFNMLMFVNLDMSAQELRLALRLRVLFPNRMLAGVKLRIDIIILALDWPMWSKIQRHHACNDCFQFEGVVCPAPHKWRSNYHEIGQPRRRSWPGCFLLRMVLSRIYSIELPLPIFIGQFFIGERKERGVCATFVQRAHIGFFLLLNDFFTIRWLARKSETHTNVGRISVGLNHFQFFAILSPSTKASRNRSQECFGLCAILPTDPDLSPLWCRLPPRHSSALECTR